MESKEPIEVRINPAEICPYSRAAVEFIVKLQLRQAGIPKDRGILHRWRDLQTDEEVFLWEEG